MPGRYILVDTEVMDPKENWVSLQRNYVGTNIYACEPSALTAAKTRTEATGVKCVIFKAVGVAEFIPPETAGTVTFRGM